MFSNNFGTLEIKQIYTLFYWHIENDTKAVVGAGIKAAFHYGRHDYCWVGRFLT